MRHRRRLAQQVVGSRVAGIRDHRESDSVIAFRIACQEPALQDMKCNIEKNGDPSLWTDDGVERDIAVTAPHLAPGAACKQAGGRKGARNVGQCRRSAPASFAARPSLDGYQNMSRATFVVRLSVPHVSSLTSSAGSCFSPSSSFVR